MERHVEVLKDALTLLGDRGKIYNKAGDAVEESFTRAARIASLWLDKNISPRDVALILASVKMARIAAAPDHRDSFVDLTNYVAFGASFSKIESDPRRPGPPMKPLPEPDMDDLDKALKEGFAPIEE